MCYFQGVLLKLMGSQKKGGPRQLPHSPHSIFTLSPTSGVLKKKGHHSESSSDLSIFVPKFSDLPTTGAIIIIFSKSSVALLGFSKFRGTKHNANLFRDPKISLGDPVWGLDS